MPTYARHKANGKYLRNTLWTSTDDDATPPDWKDDLALAFGIPAEEIECEVIPWDGDPKTLPYDEDATGEVERLPEEQREGYVKPEPVPPTLEQKVDALIAALPVETQATISEALKGG